MLHVDDAHKAVEEPLVNLGDVVNLVHGHDAAAERLTDREDALEIAGLYLFDNFCVAQLGNQWHIQRIYLHFDGADSLHHAALKAVGNRHNLAGRLHLGAQRFICVYEFIKRPARELDNAVVQRRLEASGGLAGNGVGQLVQTVAYRNLCRNLCNRIAGCLGCQCGGTRYTRVYLDNGILKGIRMQSELYVTAALNAQLGDNLERGGTQHLVLMVTQRLARCDNDGVAGVYADRINVFHVTNRDDIALAVTHHFVLDFLPARNALLDQNFVYTGVHDAGSRNLAQLVPSIRDAAAGAAEGVCRTNDNRQTDFFGKCNGVLYGVYHLGGDNRLMDFLHGVLKHLTVFRLINGGRVCAEQLDAVLVEESACHQIHGDVQTGLTAQCRQNGVRTLFLDDLFYTRNGHRLDVNLIRHGLVGHNRSRIGVYQNNLQTFFAQRTACLCACVVELGCLTDDDRAGAQYHYLMNIFAQRHY